MATVLFTWELGGGIGHLVRHRGLIQQLLTDGHRVHFHACDLEKAHQVFDGLALELARAPRGYTPPEDQIAQSNSYPEVIWNSGFSDAAAVQQRLQHWWSVVAQLKPDVVIADYSPSVVVACKLSGTRVVAIGSGFYTPPPISPLPAYHYWLANDRARLAASEARLLEVINSAATALADRPFSSVAEALVVAETFLLLFAELDPVFDRPDTEFMGVWPVPGFGIPPVWPGTGPRVFAYLEPSVLLPDILAASAALGLSLCLYAPGLRADALPAIPGLNVHLAAEPVDLVQAAAECEMAITNGNPNSLAGFLLAGKPQLAVPYTMEKYLIARRLELLGAGLSAPMRRPDNLAAKLRAVLVQRNFRRAAESFAARYAGGSEAALVQRMRERLALRTF